MASKSQKLNLATTYKKQKYVQFNSELTLNLYLVHDPQGKNTFALYPVPGLSSKVSLAEGNEIRALFSANNTQAYAVSGDRIYQLNSSLTPTDVTASTQLTTTTGYVGVAYNQNDEVIFVDASKGWIYNESSGSFTEITDSNFPGNPLDVAFLDGYFFVCDDNTNQFYASQLNKGTDWTPLQSAALNTKPDTIQGLASLRRQLYVFGNTTTEQWYNAGNADFPLRRNNSFSVDYGCAATASIAQGHDRLIWLSNTQDGVSSIMMTEGGMPKTVSNQAIDTEIQTFGTVSDAIGFIFKLDNQIFYQITFPTEKRTFLYNLNVGAWSEVQESSVGRSSANAHTYFNDQHLVGDFNSSTVFELNDAFDDADGRTLRREIITSPIATQDYRYQRLDKFELDVVKGTATQTGSTAEPELLFWLSKDGGVTYTAVRRKTVGKIGEYRRRYRLFNLGRSTDFRIKLQFDAAVPLVVLGAAAQIGYEQF